VTLPSFSCGGSSSLAVTLAVAALEHDHFEHAGLAAIETRLAVVAAEIALLVRTLHDAIAAVRSQLAIGQTSAIGCVARQFVLLAIVANFPAFLLQNTVAAIGAPLTIWGTAATAAVILPVVTGFAAVCLQDAVTASIGSCPR
jgi:hypothetical protein